MKQYYYVTPSNEKAGPVSPEEFSNLGIDGDTLVYCQGLKTWTPASQVPELVPFLPIPKRFTSEQFNRQYPPYQGRYNAYPPEKKESDNVPGLIGFIFSLLAIILMWIPYIALLGFVFWIVGLVLSIIGMTKKSKGLAIAGLVICIIYFILLLMSLFILSSYLTLLL